MALMTKQNYFNDVRDLHLGDEMKHKLLDNAKKDLIIELERAGKKDKKGYLLAVAGALDVSSRLFPSINVYKLDQLAQKNKDKVIIVPGTVLAFGTINTKVKVYAYKFSKASVEKIESAKGEVKSLTELIKDKVEGKNVIIVK
jgi:large subunit ribosomal protein L18e